MANALYPLGLQALLKGDLDLDNPVRVIMVDLGAYTYNATHDFLDDVPAGARIAVSADLTTKTFTNGVFDADDPTINTVTGTSVEALILYQHTGVEATSHLVAYWDTGVTGFPFNPNGSNVLIAWSNGAAKIFAL